MYQERKIESEKYMVQYKFYNTQTNSVEINSSEEIEILKEPEYMNVLNDIPERNQFCLLGPTVSQRPIEIESGPLLLKVSQSR